MIPSFAKFCLRLLSGILIGSGLSLAACSDHQPQATNHPAPIAPDVTVVSYRSPTCGCCGLWVDHLRDRGFAVDDRVTEDLDAIKAEYNVPADLRACHTAIVGGYVVEGHTPAEDIQRLLTERPDIDGIATPGMPLGSPGMEAGEIREPYAVWAFSAEAEPTVFAEHQ